MIIRKKEASAEKYAKRKYLRSYFLFANQILSVAAKKVKITEILPYLFVPVTFAVHKTPLI